MAVLTKEDYFKRLSEMVGTNTDDRAIKFIEDMSDTYENLERQISTNEDIESRVKEVDDKWRKIYAARFFSSNGGGRMPEEIDGGTVPEDKGPEDITVEDLFKIKEG